MRYDPEQMYSEAFWNAMRRQSSPEEFAQLSRVVAGDDIFIVLESFEKRVQKVKEKNNIFYTFGKTLRKVQNSNEFWKDPAEHTPIGCALFTVIKIPEDRMSDSDELLEEYFSEKMGERFGRSEESAFVNGTGKGMPPGVLSSLPEPSTVPMSGSAIAYDDISRLYHALDEELRKNASFLCHKSVLDQLKTIRNSDGNLIWTPGKTGEAPDMVLEQPVYTSEHMPRFNNDAESDAGKKLLVFGDFSFYRVMNWRGCTMKRAKLPSLDGQIMFFVEEHVGGKLIDSEAMRVLSVAAG